MKQNIGKLTVAASTLLIATLFSFGWSAQKGVSLSVGKAEARVGRPLTPVSVAGVARRHYRRAAIGTAAAVGAAAWGAGYHEDTGYHEDDVHHDGSMWDAHAAYPGGSPYASGTPIVPRPHYAVAAYYGNGPWYGYSGWADYAARNGITCTPGTLVKFDDGLMHVCQ